METKDDIKPKEKDDTESNEGSDGKVSYAESDSSE